MSKRVPTIIEKIKAETGARVTLGGALAEYTTYKVGGAAEYLIDPVNMEEAALICHNAWRAGIPLTILGAGSNVIAPDSGIEGITVILSGSDVPPVFFDNGILQVEAGVNLVELAKLAAEKGYSGFEPIAGIPGTVGGAIMMNAGTNDGNISDILAKVELLTPSGRRVHLINREMAFGYRKSIFQGSGWVILKAEFKLGRGRKEQLIKDVERIQEERRVKFPMDLPNAGSVFKRPSGDYAGRLIEEAGCKGMNKGDAIVSSRHANFILNKGNATSTDILGLVSEIRGIVYGRSGVYLELEQIPLARRP